VKAGLEEGRVRSARDVDDGAVGLGGELLDVRPAAHLPEAVLGVDGDVRMAGVGVHPKLHHLPVALVRTETERQLVVVEEVPQPVLQPEAPVGLDRMRVEHVVELGKSDAQAAVLLAVVLAAHADQVALLHRASVRIALRAEEGERQLRLVALRLRAGEDGALRVVGAPAAQLVAGVDHVLRRAVGEELLVGVIAHGGLKALEEVVVLRHRRKKTAPARPRQVRAARSAAPGRRSGRPRAGGA